MTLLDILQVMLFTALLIGLLVYAGRQRLPAAYRSLRYRLLPPRYLKPQGIWRRDDSSSHTKNKL